MYCSSDRPAASAGSPWTRPYVRGMRRGRWCATPRASDSTRASTCSKATWPTSIRCAPPWTAFDGVVFTMGAHDGPCMVEKIDYGAVRNTSLALDGRKVRIALMTAIGVTYMDTDYNRVSQAHDWKRRSERLVRASGNETPSCAPAGSTTTIRTSRGSFSCRATPIAMPVPRTAWYPANRSRRCWSVRSDARRLYFVKLRWTCPALNLNTVGVQLEHRRRLVPCFVVCLVYFMRECLFR